MHNEFIVNIIHRPELAPEYAAKTSGADPKAVVRESLGIFLFQQEAAQGHGSASSPVERLWSESLLLDEVQRTGSGKVTRCMGYCLRQQPDTAFTVRYVQC